MPAKAGIHDTSILGGEAHVERAVAPCLRRGDVVMLLESQL
jgi:hypothetical protein